MPSRSRCRASREQLREDGDGITGSLRGTEALDEEVLFDGRVRPRESCPNSLDQLLLVAEPTLVGHAAEDGLSLDAGGAQEEEGNLVEQGLDREMAGRHFENAAFRPARHENDVGCRDEILQGRDAACELLGDGLPDERFGTGVPGTAGGRRQRRLEG